MSLSSGFTISDCSCLLCAQEPDLHLLQGLSLSETPAHSRPPKQVEDYCSQQQSKMVELEQLIKLKDRYKTSHRRGKCQG